MINLALSGTLILLKSILDIIILFYKICIIALPSMCNFLASESVIKPLLVEIIAIPEPFKIYGIFFEST